VGFKPVWLGSNHPFQLSLFSEALSSPNQGLETNPSLKNDVGDHIGSGLTTFVHRHLEQIHLVNLACCRVSLPGNLANCYACNLVHYPSGNNDFHKKVLTIEGIQPLLEFIHDCATRHVSVPTAFFTTGLVQHGSHDVEDVLLALRSATLSLTDIISCFSTREQNLSLRKPYLSLELLDAITCTLAGVLQVKDKRVLTNACSALKYLSSSDGQQHVDLVAATTTVVPMLMQHMLLNDDEVTSPALRTLSNFLAASHAAAQSVLAQGFLNFLPPLIKSPNPQYRMEAMAAVANVAAGLPAQVDLLLGKPYVLIQMVIELLRQDASHNVRLEALRAVANVLRAFNSRDAPTQLKLVNNACVEHGAMAALVGMVDAGDDLATKLALEAAAAILDAGDKLVALDFSGRTLRPSTRRAPAVYSACPSYNPFRLPFAKAGLVGALEKLMPAEKRARDWSAAEMDALKQARPSPLPTRPQRGILFGESGVNLG